MNIKLNPNQLINRLVAPVAMLMLLTWLSLAAVAGDYSLDNASKKAKLTKWKCQYCLQDDDWRGEVAVGFGRINDAEFGFASQYRQLGDKTLALLDLDLIYSGSDNHFYTLQSNSLSRTLAFSGRHYDNWHLSLSYRQLDTVDRDYLALIANDIELSQFTPVLQRQRTKLNLSYDAYPNWQPFVELFYENKRGTKRINVSHLTQAVTLAQSIDQQASRVSLGSHYTGGKSLLSLSYQGSRFDNDQQSINWQNPLFGFALGQQAVAPDSSQHRFNVKGRYGVGANQFQGSYTFTAQEQDQSFLPSSINAGLSQPLAQLDLSGRVNKHALRLKSTFNPRNKFKFQTAFNYDRRDNNTPDIAITPVISDSFLGQPQISRPYDFSRWTVRLTGQYQMDRQNKLLATIERLHKEFSLQERDHNDRDQIKVQWRFNDWREIDSSLTLKRDLNRGDDFQAIDNDLSEQHLLRNFNIADYDLNSIDWSLGYFVSDGWFSELNLGWSVKDFKQSRLGIIEQKAKQAQWTLSYNNKELGKFQLLTSYRFEDNQSAGGRSDSSSSLVPNWRFNDRQRQTLWQLSWNKKAKAEEVFSYGAKAIYSDSEGQLAYRLFSVSSLNPAVIGEKLALSGFVQYRYDEDYDLRLDVKYQDYDELQQPNILPLGLLLSQGAINSIYDSSYIGVKVVRKL